MRPWPVDALPASRYAIGVGACPTRPWWRCGGPAHPLIGWTRNDGALFYIDSGLSTAQALSPTGTILFDVPPSMFKALPFDPEPFLADLDAGCPVAAPPPRCGQVWVDTLDRKERLVVGVDVLLPDQLWLIAMGGNTRRYAAPVLGNIETPWPPVDMVLVDGPLSPWSPA